MNHSINLSMVSYPTVNGIHESSMDLIYKSYQHPHHLLGMQTTSLTELSRLGCTWWSLRSRWMFTTRIISLDDGTYGKKKKVGRMVGFCFGQAGEVERTTQCS